MIVTPWSTRFRSSLRSTAQEIDQAAHSQQCLTSFVIGAVGNEDFVVWTVAPPSCSAVTVRSDGLQHTDPSNI
jgi:hypothetical protein